MNESLVIWTNVRIYIHEILLTNDDIEVGIK
ncbi:Uncharacterised protein [Staphylococcus caeli]|uniref:Uncharacterized protein n=1 Tax=Staphylococcus caeli TaxID=2201815 RepID=A0A1D4GP69_9STAP|nr:Uncharacterised protein [Staphylococcus caeli]SCS39823.1 Uncharacterised protein [Staphylococcus caeli]